VSSVCCPPRSALRTSQRRGNGDLIRLRKLLEEAHTSSVQSAFMGSPAWHSLNPAISLDQFTDSEVGLVLLRSTFSQNRTAPRRYYRATPQYRTLTVTAVVCRSPIMHSWQVALGCTCHRTHSSVPGALHVARISSPSLHRA